MQKEQIVIDCMKKLGQKGLSKNWFISKYLPGHEYFTINNQILGYTKKPSPELIAACYKYLEEEEKMIKQEVIDYVVDADSIEDLQDLIERCKKRIGFLEVSELRIDEGDVIVPNFPEGHAFSTLNAEQFSVIGSKAGIYTIQKDGTSIEIPKRFVGKLVSQGGGK